MKALLRPNLGLFCLILLPCASAFAQQAQPASGASYNLQVEVNRVLVPVVVRDKHGIAVTGLKQEDFQVFDNDKPRAVSAFAVQERSGTAKAAATLAANQPDGASLPPPPSTAPKAPISSHRYLLFLFDDMHLNFEDMAHAKKAAAAALEATLTEADLAGVVSTSGKTNSGLTGSPAKLLAALATLTPRAVNRSDQSDCPKIDYYQADLIANKNDSTAKEEATRQVFRCDPSLDPRTDMAMAEKLADAAASRVAMAGHQDAMAIYLTMGQFVKAMATLPGERTLVVVSPGFLPLEQDVRTAESRLIDLAAQDNVTINAMDARGLYTNSLAASEETVGNPQYQTQIRQQSMMNAENAMGELADGTGGTFFHASNDLNTGFKGVTQVADCVYMLELSLDKVKQDGSYHRLKVKVNRSDVELQSRRGYYVPKPEKAKK